MLRYFIVFALTIGVVSCAHQREYVWVDDLGDEALSAPMYHLRSGDHLTVTVWNQEHLSGDVRLRADGYGTLPLIGDVLLAGETVSTAGAVVERRLKGLVLQPKVTVSVVETRPSTITVVGEVRAPGSFALADGDRLLDAIAKAGGLTEFATDDRVFVLRQTPEPLRIRFDFDRVVRGDSRGLRFRLRDGDIVVVR